MAIRAPDGANNSLRGVHFWVFQTNKTYSDHFVTLVFDIKDLSKKIGQLILMKIGWQQSLFSFAQKFDRGQGVLMTWGQRTWTGSWIILSGIPCLIIFHWCLAANLRIGIYNGGMVFNRLLGNGWSDLDDFFGRPHEISIPMKCWKDVYARVCVKFIQRV